MSKNPTPFPSSIVMADAAVCDETAIAAFPAFRRWAEGLKRGHDAGEWNINSLVVLHVVMFGGGYQLMSGSAEKATVVDRRLPRFLNDVGVERIVRGRVGMVLAQALGTNKDGTPLNGVTFLRGDAVAILPVLRDETGRVWTVVTEQPRIPAGIPDYMEIPAGMLDGGSLKSKALDELREEVGPEFDVEEHEVIELGGVHPSPGGSDEMIHFVAFEREVSTEFLQQLDQKLSGLRDEGESIRLHVVPMAELDVKCPHDMKARMAHALWKDYEFKRTLDLMAPAQSEPEAPEGTLPFRRP